MAGDLKGKSGTTLTLTTTGASLTNGSAGAAGSAVSFKSGGTTELADMLSAVFELTVQWATVTGIAANTVVADVYFVPRNEADTADCQIDTTSGSSYIPSSYRVGPLLAAKAPTANTDAVFKTDKFDSPQQKGTFYILNRSGQTMTANWTAKVAPSDAQYT